VRSPDPLAVLYDAHAPALFRFLIRLTGDEATVKDILQEIFIRQAGGFKLRPLPARGRRHRRPCCRDGPGISR
jgi:DNA-directed RNA polymerase specialized sigma24 family protein